MPKKQDRKSGLSGAREQPAPPAEHQVGEAHCQSGWFDRAVVDSLSAHHALNGNLASPAFEDVTIHEKGCGTERLRQSDQE